MNNSVSPSLSLSDVIRGLRGSVGGWAVRGWLSAVLGLLLYRRLGEIGGRMDRMLARFRAGGLWRLGPRAGVRAVADGVRPAATERIWPGDPTVKLPRDPTAKLPRRFGWLVRAASWHAAAYTGQLRLVLGQPEMVALLAASPQAVRILRPLCQMLAVETSLLRPRPEGVVLDVSDVEAAPVVAKRKRVKPAPVDWGRIPLPRGVISAARRQGFMKR